MLCEVRSLGLSGISGYEVRAECDLSAGLPAFEIVGLPDAAVKEARDRVRAHILHCLQYPHHWHFRFLLHFLDSENGP